ncbi:MAG: pentapeptide repeat-containing protein [Romboutsia sp.]|uniref:pentapeptide repeat-containing protein n=1 Tax=Cetobacterium sp. TaxID=2071632 RepID=UPI002FC5967A
MTTIKNLNNKINYSNRKKLNNDFSNRDLRRSNCYNSDFSGSNFDNTSLRGAQFKSCTFNECTFEYTEFVATNLKKSRFKNVKFKNTIFDSVNLEGVDFEGSEFENVIFVSCDLSKALNLNLSETVKIFEEMPKLDISKELKRAVKIAMRNEYIKAARVLDTKNGTTSPISMMILLEKFDKETVIKGLNILSQNLNEQFCTLSYIIKSLETYKTEGIL